MSVFRLYIELGLNHILDLGAYDHILFIITLCAIYNLNEWKRILILVTAFTLGHSITLLLATLRIINISSPIIEFLIPLTISCTALFNISFEQAQENKTLHRIKYLAALFFGLIHGLGFSNYLKNLLGFESNIIKPLFAFNIGIEFGQILVVAIVIVSGYAVTRYLKYTRKVWNLVLSGAALGISLLLMLERLPF
jgi:hypothetical protein